MYKFKLTFDLYTIQTHSRIQSLYYNLIIIYGFFIQKKKKLEFCLSIIVITLVTIYSHAHDYYYYYFFEFLSINKQILKPYEN